jgi:predicted metal-dependent hydrolase
MGERLARGAALFDAGAHWEAHEAWEELWRAETDPRRRTCLQGLIQVAAAFHKLLVKNDTASARRLLARAIPKLEAGGADGRLPSTAFVAGTRRCLEALTRGEALSHADLPRVVADPNA